MRNSFETRIAFMDSQNMEQLKKCRSLEAKVGILQQNVAEEKATKENALKKLEIETAKNVTD